MTYRQVWGIKMIKCLLSWPVLIAGPLHSTPLQIISQSIPRLDPIDSKSGHNIFSLILEGFSSHFMFRHVQTLSQSSLLRSDLTYLFVLSYLEKFYVCTHTLSNFKTEAVTSSKANIRFVFKSIAFHVCFFQLIKLLNTYLKLWTKYLCLRLLLRN